MSVCGLTTALDYGDVSLSVDDNFVCLDPADRKPLKLSARICGREAALPFVLCYAAPGGDPRVEAACREAGVLTAGAPGTSFVELGSEREGSFDVASGVILDAVDVTSEAALTAARAAKSSDRSLVLCCSTSAKQAEWMVNSLRLADAVIVGTVTRESAEAVESLGVKVARVSLIRKIASAVDVPVIATAGSTAEACKAFVAGADAVMVHIGGPFSSSEDVARLIPTVVTKLRSSLETLCRVAGADDLANLTYRCRLTVGR